MSVLSRWKAKREARIALRSAADKSVAYWAARAGSAHGRAMLRAAVARRALRREQVGEAERVIARHQPVAGAVSDRGVAFVAGFEGFRASVYRDAVGVLTQGYGETHGITPGRAWSRAYALTRLRARLNHDYLPAPRAAAQAGHLTLKQGEADALASLSYNLGPGIFLPGHTMGDALRSGSRGRVASAFLVYDKAGGRTLLGLTRRRQAERAMFLNA